MNEEYFKALIHSYLSNQATEKDVKDLWLWINQSDDHKKQFTEIKRAWILMSQVSPRGRFNKVKYDEWRRVEEKLVPDNQQHAVVSVSPWHKILRIAAALLLLISIGTAIAWRVSSNRYHKLVNTEIVHQVNVPKGSESEVILPDGTKVNLNAGSILKYYGDFGLTSRNVTLEGEGYFDVKTDSEKPFIVEAFGLKIKALGTIFNVKAYPEENSITTTLVEGTVRVEGEGVDLIMAPKQKITYTRELIKEEQLPQQEKTELALKPTIQEKAEIRAEPPQVKLASNVNTLELTSWKDGRLIFNSEKLKCLAVLLERKFDVDIKIESEELLNYKFTGTFHQETLEQILNIINLSAPIKYEIEKGVVTIGLDPKRRAVFKEVISN